MDDKIVTLSIGGGGRQTSNFIKDIILKYFDNEILSNLGDASHVETSTNTAFTTDSFVIRPEFFNGGNIGKLAICGTVNDLSVSGAEPLYLSFALVVSEGYSYDKLEKIVKSAAVEAKKAGVKIVCGDTKVVERGGIDGIIINTCGLGRVIKNLNDFSAVKEGDKVIVTSDIARHGMAVMLERGQFGFAGGIESDCACLNHMMKAVYPYNVKFGRDATRGGLAAVLNEIAEQSCKGFLIDEEKIPLRQDTAELCDTLGFDPLSVANEGAAVIICGAEDCEKVLAALKSVKEGERATVIGEVTNDNKVVLNTISGGKRHIDLPPGELLPRIC
ncbi:MAG: hydrogenase expression/formation protein HypE [Mucispirillum sp.]|nr:hydrogenase expression/formation protein HypE [Mucispirillum sp.]